MRAPSSFGFDDVTANHRGGRKQEVQSVHENAHRIAGAGRGLAGSSLSRFNWMTYVFNDHPRGIVALAFCLQEVNQLVALVSPVDFDEKLDNLRARS